MQIPPASHRGSRERELQSHLWSSRAEAAEGVLAGDGGALATEAGMIWKNQDGSLRSRSDM